MQPNDGSSKLKRPDTGLRALVMFAALIVVLAGLREAKDIILPVLLAGFLAAVSWAPITWLRQKLRFPLWAAVIAVFLGVLLFFGGVSAFITSSVASFSENVSTYQARITAQLEPLLALLAQYGVEVSTSTITSQLNTNQVMGTFASALTGLTSLLSDTLFVLLTTVFIIFEAADLPDKLRVARRNRTEGEDKYAGVVDELKSYIGIKTLVSAITGVGAGVLCWVVGVDYPLLWALVAFLLNFVPTLGSIIAAVPPVLLGFIQFGWERALVVLAGYLVINMVVGNVIEPRIMGEKLGLSTLVVFLSLVFWGFVWGPLGMLLCVPLTMIAKILLQNSDDLRWIGVFLGTGDEARRDLERMEKEKEEAKKQAKSHENVRDASGRGSLWSARSTEALAGSRSEAGSAADGAAGDSPDVPAPPEGPSGDEEPPR